jgi:hypothetical protein
MSRWLSLALICGLTIACKPVASETPTAQPASPPAAVASPEVAGDVIVKFRDASEPGRVVAPILTGQSRIDSAVPMVSDLSNDLGSPLTVVRVTSGRELVLAIDRVRVGQIISLRADNVSAIRSMKPADSSARLASQQQLEFVVEPQPGSDVEKAISSITGNFQPHARSRIDEDGRVLLTIDMTGLTRQTVEQLKKRSDVEYAQANVLLKPYPRMN